MNYLEIAKDLKNFLIEKKELIYDFSKSEPGKITLKSINDLKIEEILIDSENSPIYDDDPNKNKKGYYSVPAVSLINTCEFYEPDFILLWLPNEKLYGTWDCDHSDLKIFLDINWSNIESNPLPFINSQWDNNSKVGTYFKPFKNYKFIEGSPF